MKKYIVSHEDIFAMSNVMGRFIKVEPNLDFSFYYSPRNSSHGPRVKPVMNPQKMKSNEVGLLKLCDDWEFIPCSSDKNVSKSRVNKMKEFFRKYLILFLLVWDGKADDPDLGYYLQGQLELSEFIQHLDFYDEYSEELDKITSVHELEYFCRQNNLVNMYDN